MQNNKMKEVQRKDFHTVKNIDQLPHTSFLAQVIQLACILGPTTQLHDFAQRHSAQRKKCLRKNKNAHTKMTALQNGAQQYYSSLGININNNITQTFYRS